MLTRIIMNLTKTIECNDIFGVIIDFLGYGSNILPVVQLSKAINEMTFNDQRIWKTIHTHRLHNNTGKSRRPFTDWRRRFGQYRKKQLYLGIVEIVLKKRFWKDIMKWVEGRIVELKCVHTIGNRARIEDLFEYHSECRARCDDLVYSTPDAIEKAFEWYDKKSDLSKKRRNERQRVRRRLNKI